MARCAAKFTSIIIAAILTVSTSALSPTRFCETARALNSEVKALLAAGYRYILADEPLFARKPAETLGYGIANLDLCFEGVGPQVARVVHIRYGYPTKLDDKDYKKTDPNADLVMAEPLDPSAADQISVEDGQRHNDLNLLERFRESTVIFGSIAVANSVGAHLGDPAKVDRSIGAY